LLSSKSVTNGTLNVYKGFPHGMATTHADVINADILSFIKSYVTRTRELVFREFPAFLEKLFRFRDDGCLGQPSDSSRQAVGLALRESRSWHSPAREFSTQQQIRHTGFRSICRKKI
jgi:hypothetical protein